MRLDKFLAKTGWGSRKEVKKIIKNKYVTVNGQIVDQANHHLNLDKDQVMVGQELIHYEKYVYYMLHKPAGFICSHDNSLHPSALDLIQEQRDDLIMVGRLDLDTTGLLLITNDGKFSHRIAHGKKEVYKSYQVQLKDSFDPDFIPILEAGMTLDEKQLKPAYVEIIHEKEILLSIAEGKYHQVKRMMQACNNEVTQLKRIKIGQLSLDKKLEEGAYRPLTKEEIQFFAK